MRKGLLIGFVVYLLFGLYFVNSAFLFKEVPNFISNIDKWITLVGGLLIVVGAVNYLRISKRKKVFPSI